jgi:diacylglycerol kinase family enzyme
MEKLRDATPVFLNARARAFRREGVGAVLERVREACAASGLEAWVEVLPPDRIAGAVREAAESGASVVVVGGGDGTVRTAAEALADGTTALGIIPLGRLNHCARDLGLPRDAVEAARVVAAGATTSVDLGDLGGRTFVNTSALGVYPHLVRARAHHERRFKWGRLVALLRSAWATFWRFPTLDVHVRRPEGVGAMRTPLVFVGNNEYVLGPRFGTRRTLDAGVLYLCAVRPTGRWRFLWLCVRSLVFPVPPEDRVATTLVEEVELDLRGRGAWVTLDGELERVHGRLVYRIRPRALRVVVDGARTDRGDA